MVNGDSKEIFEEEELMTMNYWTMLPLMILKLTLWTLVTR